MEEAKIQATNGPCHFGLHAAKGFAAEIWEPSSSATSVGTARHATPVVSGPGLAGLPATLLLGELGRSVTDRSPLSKCEFDDSAWATPSGSAPSWWRVSNLRNGPRPCPETADLCRASVPTFPPPQLHRPTSHATSIHRMQELGRNSAASKRSNRPCDCDPQSRNATACRRQLIPPRPYSLSRQPKYETRPRHVPGGSQSLDVAARPNTDR